VGQREGQRVIKPHQRGADCSAIVRKDLDKLVSPLSFRHGSTPGHLRLCRHKPSAGAGDTRSLSIGLTFVPGRSRIRGCSDARSGQRKAAIPIIVLAQ
jgi:hypothetical protein